MIDFFCEEVSCPDLVLDKVANWLNATVESNNKMAGDIAIIFCSDAYLLSMNKQYLNHDYFTDIITFDYSEGSMVSGDLFISIDTVNHNAKKFGVTFEQELLRVVIHGVLHLLGFNDKTNEEQKIMRENEERSLKIYYNA
ncbi:MAG: rRNA maturation RNase YbeY [Bacteroidetes bacterium HGW-Bacteroidetes-4]|nr:MAG: rRNA maturation RNase YbeY [Bacteroidetes bacterium HGW-Bacteroidetes-4]